jgi:hypothetical protein
MGLNEWAKAKEGWIHALAVLVPGVDLQPSPVESLVYRMTKWPTHRMARPAQRPLIREPSNLAVDQGLEKLTREDLQD